MIVHEKDYKLINVASKKTKAYNRTEIVMIFACHIVVLDCGIALGFKPVAMSNK